MTSVKCLVERKMIIKITLKASIDNSITLFTAKSTMLPV